MWRVKLNAHHISHIPILPTQIGNILLCEDPLSALQYFAGVLLHNSGLTYAALSESCQEHAASTLVL
eukprot:4953089-Amphidinium_carterae.1